MKTKIILAAAAAVAVACVAASAAASDAADAATAAASGDAVTMQDYLDRLKDTHPFFQREQLQPLIEQKQSDRFLGWQDWRLNANAGIAHIEPLQTSPFEPEQINAFSVGAGTERLFWGTGSRLSVDWTSDATDQKIPGLSVPGPGGPVEIPVGPSTFYRNILSATYSLPLMQNRGGELDRLEYELSLFDVDASEITALENQEGFLLDAGATYLAWVLAEEQIAIAQDRLDFALEELERSQRKRGAFLVDEVDVSRSRDAVYGTQSALFLIESQWKAVQADLATQASDESIYQAKPVHDIYEMPDPGDVDEYVDYVINRSRVVRALKVRREKLVRFEQGTEDVARPSLDLNVGAALMGGDENVGGSWEITNPDVGVGLVFSYPINNRTATADVEQTRLQIRQLEKTIQNAQITLEASVRSIMVRMRELRDVIDNNIEQIASNRQRTEEELKLYEQGRSDLTFVIQSRDRIALSQLEYAGNAAEYHNLLLQLRALADELLPTPAPEPSTE
jgi:outer membrane protein TolC